MLKEKNEFQDVSPKYMEPVSTYEPTILNKYKSKFETKNQNKSKALNKKGIKPNNLKQSNDNSL